MVHTLDGAATVIDYRNIDVPYGSIALSLGLGLFFLVS
jgi:hypothetical protein